MTSALTKGADAALALEILFLGPIREALEERFKKLLVGVPGTLASGTGPLLKFTASR